MIVTGKTPMGSVNKVLYCIVKAVPHPLAVPPRLQVVIVSVLTRAHAQTSKRTTWKTQ